MTAWIAAAAAARVVVFGDAALVVRSAEAPCERGRATVELAGLPPATELETARATAEAGEVLGMRVAKVDRAEAFSRRAAALDAEVTAARAREASLADELAAAEQAVHAAAGLESSALALMGRELPAGSADARGWSAALALAESQSASAAEQKARAAADHARAAARRKELEAERRMLDEAALPFELRAEVQVRCAGPSARVQLATLVRGASWTPSYEARERSSGEVELSVFATVQQTTGESWSGAALSLSTGAPALDATPPALEPLHVYALPAARARELRHREVAMKHLPASANARSFEAVVTSIPGVTQPARRAAAAPAIAAGDAVDWPLPAGVDVPGDGTPARLLVGRWTMPACFALKARPSAARAVFRVADVTSRAPFALLPGRVDVYSDAGLVARHPIGRVSTGEPLQLSFGLEERVRVRRTVRTDKLSSEGLFKKSQRLERAFRYELVSLLAAPAEVELADRIPVSELADVEVALDDATSPDKRVGQDGEVTFAVSLAPGASAVRELAFHVRASADYDLQR